ncbi:TRAP transporter small permease [bacterium LRH843]|nr:TRAP transporter small permease [bacterium LRH843]
MKLFKLFDKYIEEIILVPLFSVMVLSIGSQVFMRKFLNSSLAWSEELARYCFIWLVFIGISYAAKHRKHINVNILPEKLFKNILPFISTGFFLVFAIIVIIYGSNIVDKLFGFKQISPALTIPMGFIYLAAPVGMLLTVFRLIQNLYNDIQTIRKS